MEFVDRVSIQAESILTDFRDIYTYNIKNKSLRERGVKLKKNKKIKKYGKWGRIRNLNYGMYNVQCVAQILRPLLASPRRRR